MNWWVFKKRLHTAWLIAGMSLSILVGIYASAAVVPGLFGSLVWLMTGLALCLTTLHRRTIYLVPLLIIGGLMVGLWRGSVSQYELQAYNELYKTQVILNGVVRDDIDTDGQGLIKLRVSGVNRGDRLLPGVVWASASTNQDIKRGDRVTIEGTLLPGFGSYVASMYQANVTHIERPEPGDVARVFRDWFANAVRLAVPDPQASLGLGYLLGQKKALPADLQSALQIVGLTHVVVASGYNLTILVRLARRLFEKISKYLSALSSMAMIAGFIAVTGMSPSMSRAGLVATLSLAAWYYGRRFHPLVLLPVAAAVTVLVNPSYLWGDLGWQLSFAAFAGVMILAPLLHAYFFGDTRPGFIRQVLFETLSALVATAPLIIFAFGQFSNVAIIANMLVLPLVPIAMLLTFIAGIGALIVPGIATIVGLPASWLLGYMIHVANYLSNIPWATTSVSLPSWVIVSMYAGLIGLCVYLQRVTRFDLGKVNIVE